MSDVELVALAALAQARATEVQAANADRANRGYSPAYGEDFAIHEADMLEVELRRRGVYDVKPEGT